MVIIVITYTWLFARYFCKPKRNKTKKIPIDYGLPAELIRFQSQGKRLEGWFISKNRHYDTDKIVILTHGWSTNLSLLLPLARFLFNSGSDLFLYDSRGHGNSADDGPITLKKMAQDVSSAIDYAYKKLKTANLPVIIVGHSMGASAGILAASYDHRIERIIACSPFSDPKTLTTRHLRQKRIPMGILVHLVFYFMERWLGTKMKNISPINRINHIEKDILLIHGTKDKVIPYADSVSLETAGLSNKTNLLKIEKRGHYDILRDSIFMNNTVAFINGIKV